MRRSARIAGIATTVKTESLPKRIKSEHIKVEYDNDVVKKEEVAVKTEEVEKVKIAPIAIVDPSEVINHVLEFPDVSSYEQGDGPKSWPQMLTHVRNTRLRTIAAVDTMGCERLPETKVESKLHRYQLLIALMLSAQTRDETNAWVMGNLRQKLPGGLTVDSILAVDVTELDMLIFKVGFHSRKANYIKQATQILRDKYNDDVPPTIEEMMALPGVGPKMAHLLMHRAWGKADGIGVDVHVDRLARMWGWTKGKTPEHTRMDLEKWLPKELWIEINPLLVGFGQAVCMPRPRGAQCGLCDLSGTGLCPADKLKKR